MGGDSRGKQRESRAAAAGCGSAGSCQALMQRISHERLGLGLGQHQAVTETPVAVPSDWQSRGVGRREETLQV